MGCGKSTLGKILAERFQYKFIDLDKLIEEKESLTISEIFALKGEDYFRELEKVALNSILTMDVPLILSLGGGTVCHSGIAADLNKNKNILVCYLKLSPQVIFNRLISEKQSRPILNGVDNLQEFIQKHLNQRESFYAMANLTLDGVVDPEEVFSEIRTFIGYLNSSTT